MNNDALARARGCLLGQLAGDALGGLVEFCSPEEIRRRYPKGVRRLTDGGTWNTIAGQPTDDSEMALALARTLVGRDAYDAEAARRAYVDWLRSEPFDVGSTVGAGLRGRPNPQSQANGALMRISPLGIFGVRHDEQQVADWARQDAALTHPHPICLQAGALFAVALSEAIRDGIGPAEIYTRMVARAERPDVLPELRKPIAAAADSPPDDYVTQQGWVLIALQNALWQLLHAPDLEEGVVDTVMRGGDTDTNAAIAGALLGAVFGEEAIPSQWREAIAACRPDPGRPGVVHPRPRCYWPIDAPELAEGLLGKGGREFFLEGGGEF